MNSTSWLGSATTAEPRGLEIPEDVIVGVDPEVVDEFGTLNSF
jgi:hypothetical protein